MIFRPICRSLNAAALLLGLIVGPALEAAESAAPSHPDILVLFADDLTYEAIGAFGHTDIDTPNLDRLVARGTSFTRASNMGSWTGAVCVASRTMLLTGRSLWDARRVSRNLDAERAGARLWPQLLRDAGYRCCMTGKWHLDTDPAACFDVARHVRPGMPADTPSAYHRPPAEGLDAWSPTDPSLGGYWDGGRHWSEVTADDCIGFLAEAGSSDQPLFCYVAFNAPHDPRQAPQDFLDRYPLERIALPEPFSPEYPDAAAIGAGPSLRDEKLAPFPRTQRAVKVHRREYYALISHLDAQVGRILDALDASGRADRTWIFFTADHGLAVGHHGLMGKQNLHDHSVRVPFVVAGPGVAAGVTDPTPIYLQDVMPTALELAGVSRPEHVFFQSLLPRLGPASPDLPLPYPAIYGGYLALQRSIVCENWKLIIYPNAGRLRLYDLALDPQETTDLAAAPEHAARLRRLFDAFLALQQDLGDDLDLESLRP
jgi:arylsulfatase A-like enzyme